MLIRGDPALTVAASMKAADVNNNLLGRISSRFAADQREAPRRPPVSPFPRKGFSSLSPIRPASIRTLCGAVCSGAGWGSQSSTGADYLGVELLLSSGAKAVRSAATSQSPELGDTLSNSNAFQAASALRRGPAVLLRKGS